VTIAPLSGWVGRNFLSSVRKPVHAAASTSRLLVWVVYRPAVSSNTASSVNHQSQLRVPPMPLTASLPIWPSSGKRRPELTSAVVLPEPGAPMNMYQGSWYR